MLTGGLGINADERGIDQPVVCVDQRGNLKHPHLSVDHIGAVCFNVGIVKIRKNTGCIAVVFWSVIIKIELPNAQKDDIIRTKEGARNGNHIHTGIQGTILEIIR